MTSVFAQFTRSDAPVYFPGAPFLLSLGLIVIALAVFLNPRNRAVAA
jgi:DHA1 family tetracycline resistance protein-like MFS transporter